MQFSKQSSTKQLIKVKQDGSVEKLWFHRAQCKGVKKCERCDHTVCNSAIRNTCREHIDSSLVRVEDCDVEFVYLIPENTSDNRRWIGGLLRKHSFSAAPSILYKQNELRSRVVNMKQNITYTGTGMW